MALQYRRALAAKLHKIRHPEALGVLREALETDPFDPETLRQLGNCLNDHGLLSESVEMFRRAIALKPDDADTFSNLGSFNNAMKLTPATVACWAQILKAVPSAQLILKAGFLADPQVRTSLAGQFEAQGIEPQRFELRSHLAESGAHLAAYGEIDIALDPLIYNGTTTTCEALIMGVPVISWIGDRHAARVGFDLLSRVGLGELATEDREAYVTLAVSLANDLPRLQRIRGELRERMLRSPICDANRFARQFEAALRQMWREWCAQPEG